MNKANHKHNFFLRIVLPTLLVFILFTISFFIFIIPTFEATMLKGKKEMISELTNSAWSILHEKNEKYKENLISLDEAKNRAAEQIGHLRYGEEGKDYFWITDEHPTMIIHPYRPELNGTDLSLYSDPEGKKLFVEFVNIVKKSGNGFVEYKWQWKDDSTKIVPKLSYVREFKPWGWIIGTGIYIDDVYEEIDALIGKVLLVTLGILLLVGIILFYVGRQSFKIEHERLGAESNLKESENKYRALVEASTDGLIMILEGQFAYTNNAFLEILGYSPNDIDLKIEDIILKTKYENISGIEYFYKLLKHNEFKDRCELNLINKKGDKVDVILYTSNISFGDKKGYTIIVKDVSANKLLDGESDLNRARFKDMIGNINIGVFRSGIGKKSRFIEGNSALVKIFGFDNFDDLREIKLSDIFQNSYELELFFDNLTLSGEQKNKILQIRKKDGLSAVISISGILIKDEKSGNDYFDGIIEDISEKIKVDEERENLIVELQTSLKFLHQPIENFLSHIVKCNFNNTIHDCAKIMTRNKYSAALIISDNDDCIGIVSDHDLRERVIAEGINLNESVHKVMSAPLIVISANDFVYEALIKMHENSTRHLAVKNNEAKSYRDNK